MPNTGSLMYEAMELVRQGAVPRGRLAELLEDIRKAAAYWTIAVTYRAPGGHTETTNFGEWPTKPDLNMEDGTVRFDARVNQREEPTVIIPIHGAIAIEIKQVTDAG